MDPKLQHPERYDKAPEGMCVLCDGTEMLPFYHKSCSMLQRIILKGSSIIDLNMFHSTIAVVIVAIQSANFELLLSAPYIATQVPMLLMVMRMTNHTILDPSWQFALDDRHSIPLAVCRRRLDERSRDMAKTTSNGHILSFLVSH